MQRIGECGCNEYHFYVTKSAISLSLDSTPASRELVSKLLSASYPDVLTMEDIGKVRERCERKTKLRKRLSYQKQRVWQALS